jgi:feruloyl esterase
MRLAFIACALLAAPAAQAQLTPSACEALANTTGVDSARFVPAGTIDARNPFPYKTPVPDHCQLNGRLAPHTGIDGKPYAIGYELRLPMAWNGKFFFQGGGGSDGVVRTAAGTLPGGGPVTNALSQGYAVASTDAGHEDEPGPLGAYQFGLDPQARIDKGYNHIPVVHEFASATIKRLHGRAQRRSYFVGCSNGGRQAMAATQRFPALFDGVIAGAPAYRVAQASIEAMSHEQLLAAIAPRFPDGTPDIGNALTPDDLKLAATAILDACDAADGLRDGMIFNPKACRFDAATLACKPGQTTACLPAPKAEALSKIHAGRKTSAGNMIYSDWPYDPGLAAPGWAFWRTGTPGKNPPDARNLSLIPGSLAYYFTTPPEPVTDLLKYTLAYDFDRDSPKVDRSAPPFSEPGGHIENAPSTDLSAFTAHGGKIIFYHGLADPIFSANDTMRYLDALPNRDAYARLYLVPGMNHCSGGPAADQFAVLDALDTWVESKTAPGPITASARPGTPWPGRTRPLCPYPQSASYVGGDPERAESFSCK